jgi:hypothetical protein
MLGLGEAVHPSPYITPPPHTQCVYTQTQMHTVIGVACLCLHTPEDPGCPRSSPRSTASSLASAAS